MFYFYFSVTEFQKIYDQLDVSLIERGESFYNERMPVDVEELKKAGMYGRFIFHAIMCSYCYNFREEILTGIILGDVEKFCPILTDSKKSEDLLFTYFSYKWWLHSVVL